MKRTTKRRLGQGLLYLLLLAGLVLILALADWPTIRENFFNPAAFGEGDRANWSDLITVGLKNTIIYTAIAYAGGLALALVLALMKLSPVGPYRWLATAWIELFRGMPALLVIFLMAFGIPIAFSGWTPPGGMLGAGLLALVFVSSAYMAESVRAGIQAVPKGQAEAARSLGMGAAHTQVSVVLPQAFRIVIPPLTNEFVLLLKDTSLLFVVGFLAQERDLTTLARDMMSSSPTAGTATSLVQATILYLIITIPLTQLVAWMERRQQRTL